MAAANYVILRACAAITIVLTSLSLSLFGLIEQEDGEEIEDGHVLFLFHIKQRGVQSPFKLLKETFIRLNRMMVIVLLIDSSFC